MKGSLIILLYDGYWHMIEFSEFNVFHNFLSVGIQEHRVYTHMVTIIGKARNDLFIRV